MEKNYVAALIQRSDPKNRDKCRFTLVNAKTPDKHIYKDDPGYQPTGACAKVG
jgi:hypothetical protein